MSSAKPGPISGTTGLMGLLGNPIRHSLSPTIHNAALQALGIDWVYLALPVQAAELAGVMRALEALDCHGLSVTLPHKRAVAALVAERSPLAERLGAVNTLVRRQAGGWLGTNTDVEGFMAPLRANDWQGRRAVVLGCGGSALAVVAGLEMLGFASIQVAGRDPAQLEAFCQGGALLAYGEGRNLPGEEGTSALSAALTFGTLSPRQAWAAAQEARQLARSTEAHAVDF